MLTVSIAAADFDDLGRKSAGAFAAGAQAVEVRADSLADPDPARAREAVAGKAVYTLRPVREGGRYSGDECGRLTALRAAARAGFDFIDVEHDAPPDAAGDGARVIRSIHCFDGPPADLDRLVLSLSSSRPAVVKVACFCEDAVSEARLVAAQRRFGSVAAIFGFGPSSVASRVLGVMARAPIVYASMGHGFETAPGQPDLGTLLRVYRAGSVGPDTLVFGIAGSKISRSRSPAFHNAAFAEKGVDAVYLPLECPDFRDLWSARAVIGLSGLSITMPHKEAALRVADFACETAIRAGCANTLTKDGGKWLADNTDVPAVLEALRGRAAPLQGARALVLGAGGAARAAVAALISAGASVTISARDPVKGARLAAEFGVGSAGADHDDLKSFGIIVNATPVGMHPLEACSPVDSALLQPGQTVLDMVYGPGDTPLVSHARRIGCTVISGDELFERQALLQQRIWERCFA